VIIQRPAQADAPRTGQDEGAAAGRTAMSRLSSAPVLASAVDLNGPGHYLHWGIVQISVANALVIVSMLVVFGLALVLPFPRGRGR
jgi:hypothetical protein